MSAFERTLKWHLVSYRIVLYADRALENRGVLISKCAHLYAMTGGGRPRTISGFTYWSGPMCTQRRGRAAIAGGSTGSGRRAVLSRSSPCVWRHRIRGIYFTTTAKATDAQVNLLPPAALRLSQRRRKTSRIQFAFFGGGIASNFSPRRMRSIDAAYSCRSCTFMGCGVTMGWLLRLVTGGPTGGRGPRQL